MLGFRGIRLCTFRTTQHAAASHGALTCTPAGTLLGKCTERLEKGQAEAARPTRAAGWPHLFLAVPLKAVRAARGRCWSSAGGHGLFPGPTRKRRGVRAAAPPDPASQRMPVSETLPWGQRAGWGKEENLPEETTAGVGGGRWAEPPRQPWRGPPWPERLQGGGGGWRELHPILH